MKIYCANPKAQFLSQQPEIEDAVLRVLRSDRYILGTEVMALEEEFAMYIGVENAVGVANGTDALEIAIKALGIGFTDEVITVSHTAVATVAAIESAGAVPVLVDVDPLTFTMNPLELSGVITNKTKAIVLVHIYGQSADLDAIQDLCKKNNLKLIEDVSQAHGALWKGKRLGSFGDIACFSCYPTKNLGAIGDAGLITTNNNELAKKIRMMREYGWQSRYISEAIGRNSRLDEIQAAILRVKLRKLDSDNKKRKEIAGLYSEGLKTLPIILPVNNSNSESVFHLYVIKSKLRDRLREYLIKRDIEPGIHYPVPVHLQPAYLNRIRTSNNMNVTEVLATEVLSLPIYPELNETQIARVISTVKKFYEEVV